MTPATRKKLLALIKEIRKLEVDVDEPLRKLLEVGSKALQIEKANACIDLALATDDRDVREVVGFVATPLLARHLRRGDELAPRIDELVGLLGRVPDLRVMFPRIPPARREKIWARELAYWAKQTDHDIREQGRWLVDRFEKELLDVVPEAAPFIAKYRVAVARPRKTKPPRRRLFPSKNRKAPYVFADPFIINAGAWDAFADVDRKQLLLAAKRMTGKKVRTPSAIARAINPDVTDDDFELRLWTVYRKNPRKADAPVFDCWVFGVDNAVFFAHGTTKRVQVYVLQDSFMDDDGKRASEKLAADLEASAPESLWLT